MRKKYFIIGCILIFIASLFTLKFVQEREANKDVSNLNVYKAMLRCRIHPEKETKMKVGANNYGIPLPKASARVQDEIFITRSLDMDEYFDEILPASGWKRCDNFGDVHVIKNDNGKDTLLFLAKPYSKSYMMINYKSL
jgi:hypothetical protein